MPCRSRYENLSRTFLSALLIVFAAAAATAEEYAGVVKTVRVQTADGNPKSVTAASKSSCAEPVGDARAAVRSRLRADYNARWSLKAWPTKSG